MSRWYGWDHELRKRGAFSDDAKYRAGQWASCAVGERTATLNLSEHFEQNKGGKNIGPSTDVYHYGMEFYYNVLNDNRDSARETWKKIQDLLATRDAALQAGCRERPAFEQARQEIVPKPRKPRVRKPQVAATPEAAEVKTPVPA